MKSILWEIDEKQAVTKSRRSDGSQGAQFAINECFRELFSVDLEDRYKIDGPRELKDLNSLDIIRLWHMLEEKLGLSLSSNDIIGAGNLGNLAITLENLLASRK